MKALEAPPVLLFVCILICLFVVPGESSPYLYLMLLEVWVILGRHCPQDGHSLEFRISGKNLGEPYDGRFEVVLAINIHRDR